MKLAIVHDWLTGMRGGEKCLEAVCRRFPEASLFTLLHAPGRTSPAIERMDIRTSFLQHVPGARCHYRYLLPLMPLAIESLELPCDADVVLSFSHAVAKGVIPPRGVPHVCYCFTPMRYAWHLRGDYFERQRDDKRYGVLSGKLLRRPLAGARNLLLDRIRDWDRRTADRVTRFAAVSRTVAQRIEDCYGRPSTVVYPPVDTEFYAPGAAAREDFYLCAGALVPYKRVDLAIAACESLGKRLVVIGDGPERFALERTAGSRVSFLGWQSDEVIRDHYRRCRALLFPGREDFGIVPVEAQACGAAVIAYGEGGATESILDAEQGGSTGWFFGEQSAAALAEAIQRAEATIARFCPRRARDNALRFNAPRFERELIGLLEEVVGWREPHDGYSPTSARSVTVR